MKALSFHFRRFLHGEDFLQTLSVSQPDLLDEMKDKNVAIVGNALSLLEQDHGQEIDCADVVLRMHAAPLPNPVSHGTKTSWLALGMPVAQKTINLRNPDRLLWMAKKRKRLRYRFVMAPGFYLHPKSNWEQLASHLGAPPTTGAMLIELVARSKAAKIDLYGFDFFASLSISGRRTASQVPHDFASEKEFVHNLATQDTRVVLHQQKT